MTSGAEDLYEVLRHVRPLHQYAAKAVAGSLAEHDVTMPMRAVLERLADGPQTVPQVARSLWLPRQVVQRLADAAAGLGYLRYADNPAHRRSKLAALTETGRRVFAEIHDDELADLQALADRLDPADIKACVRVISALTTHTREVAQRRGGEDGWSTPRRGDPMIRYQETGTGHAVVLLHGGAMDLRMWDDQVPALAAHYRVIRVDARGHGRSETPTVPFRQCDDIADLLGKLGVERAALIGLSMGAGAATDTTLEYPHLVSHLVVCGAGTNEPTFADPWIRDLQRRMAEAQQRLDAPAWIDLFVKMGVVGPYREEMDGTVLARCREMITDTVRNHVRPDAVAPTHVRGSWERLGEISVPALGIIGSLDAVDHREMVDRFVAAVPGARKAVIDGAAHMPNMERPAEFNDVLLSFLSSGSGPA